MAISQPSMQNQDDEIDLMALIRTVWLGKLWISLTAVIAIFIGGYYAYEVAVPLYPSKSIVALETKQEQVVDIESVLSGNSGGAKEVNTEVEVIRSRNIITALVNRLNLIDDPEFNGTLRKPNKYSIKSIIGFIKGKIKGQAGTQEAKPKSKTVILNAVIDRVTSVISVVNIQQTFVFAINVTTTDPEKSALMANTLADLYIQNSLNEKFVATQKASEWLSEKAAELKLELEASEIKVKVFNEGTQLVSAEALAIKSIQFKEIRERISDSVSKRASTEAKLASYDLALKSGDIQTIVDVADDSRLTRMAKQLNAGTIKRTSFNAQAIAIQKNMQLDVTRLKQQYEAFLKSEKLFKREIDKQSTDLLQLQQLQREAEATGLLYGSFLQRLKETAVQQGLQKPDSRLLSSAVPRSAKSPKKNVILLLSAMLGVIFGSALVLLRELRNNTFRTADDLEAYTGYGVLGSIPKAKASKRKGVLKYAKDKPTSVFAEAIRNLRTSILLSDIDSPPQVIMSTSSVPGEGKTTQTLTLAQNMAGLNKRVLVLECDVRRRVIASYFGLKPKFGFLTVMSGKATVEDAIFRPIGMDYDILVGEKSAVNAADIFASAKFEDLIKSLREQYDYIIIDTAPVLAVPDARVIGQHSDAIIYSVLWNSTTKTQVKQGLAMFETVGLRASGLVLSNVDSKEMKRYGYAGQYGYAYGDAKGYYDN